MIYKNFIGKFVIVTSKNSGVFAGTFQELDGSSVLLINGMRIIEKTPYDENDIDGKQLLNNLMVLKPQKQFQIDHYSVLDFSSDGFLMEGSMLVSQPLPEIILLDCGEVVLASEKLKDYILEIQKNTKKTYFEMWKTIYSKIFSNLFLFFSFVWFFVEEIKAGKIAFLLIEREVFFWVGFPINL